MHKKISIFIIGLIIAVSGNAHAASVFESDHAQAALVADVSAIVPGKSLKIALLLSPKAGWHTYWENPGAAGLATTFEWTLPEGFSVGEVDWPPPTRIKEDLLAVYGYESEALFPVTLTPAATLDKTAQYPIKLKATWLICSNICIPESAEFDLPLPVAELGAPSSSAALFSEHTAAQPKPIATPAAYTDDGKHMIISVPLSALLTEHPKSAYFFPRQSNLIAYDDDQHMAINRDMLVLTIQSSGLEQHAMLSGVLMVSGETDTKYFDINLMQQAPAAAKDEAQNELGAAAEQTLGLPLVLLFALIGGLILNLMPCVLPVLSLKALAIVKKSGGERPHVIKQGIGYTLGILVSFAAFAGVLIALQHAGQAVGWGYQMQSPAFVGFLAYLLFLVGLNLLNVFHLPVLLGNVGGAIANESSARGSFFTGVLATAVATPCTAPFMASALGVALTLPAWQSMLVFETLGLGLALPFLLISIFPACLKILPKPGAWMEIFKKILSLPMFASVLWLLWVLWLQAGWKGLAAIGLGMALMVAAILIKRFLTKPMVYRGVAISLFALAFAGTLSFIGFMEMPPVPMPGGEMMHDVDTVEFSAEALADLRAKGKPVFVDATAAWCITCQVNWRAAIRTERVMQAFRERGVTLMIADWTRRNPEISQLLKNFGYQGVPLYVFYPAGHAKPVVLPQILTQDGIIGALNAPGN